MHPQQISILGVGLLGGSIGLALRAAASNCKIIGYGHRPETLAKSIELDAIDRGESNLIHAVEGSDLVILCTPVGLFENLLLQMKDHLKPGCIITDVGSTKRSVVEQAEKILPKSVHFVGSHPMAGSERRGVEFAKPDLFRGALCILTPTKSTSPQALQSVDDFWKLLGMRITLLAADVHDRLLADVSHLPHVVAAALVAMQEDAALDLCGKGFIDATRIAGGDGGLWRDILVDNAENMRSSVARLIAQLSEVLNQLNEPRGGNLKNWLDQAAARRQALLERKLKEINPE